MNNLIEKISNILWGPHLVVMLAALGLILGFKTRFFHITKLPKIIKDTLGSLFLRKKDTKSAFGAMCLALGGTIGVGNIAGVSAAIIYGGPGSIFWMWISGFLGMIIKYFEINLSVRFREKSQSGFCGGPMYYMRNSGSHFLKILGILFAVFCVLSSIFMGCMVQTSAEAGVIEDMFGIKPGIIAAGVVLSIVPIIFNRANKIKNASQFLVPFMFVVYITICLISLFSNIYRVPNALWSIFSSAFGFKSAIGGVGGYSLSKILSVGFSRGLFTNESGMGSAPIAHASNPEATPHNQGMWGIVEVFIDTIVICTLTALTVLCSDAYCDKSYEYDGLKLSLMAICEGVGETLGGILLCLCVILFAHASIMAWNYYGKRALTFLCKSKYIKYAYSLLFIISACMGCFIKGDVLLHISDIINAPLITTNIIALSLLYPYALKDNKL